MGAATILRVIKRPVRKVLLPFRLMLVRLQFRHSENELRRLRELRAELGELEARECIYQVQLAVRRCQLERS
jgi:hypothetical protein